MIKYYNKKDINIYFKKTTPYLVWGTFFTVLNICASFYSKLYSYKLKNIEFPYPKKEMKGDFVEFFKIIYEHFSHIDLEGIFSILIIFLINIFLIFSFRVQYERIKEKLRNKSKLNEGSNFSKHLRGIIIENKNRVLIEFIYFLNKFIYHLGSAVLFIFIYKYIGFFIRKISILFIFKKAPFNFKNNLFELLAPIGNISYFSISEIIYPWLFLTLIFFFS